MAKLTAIVGPSGTGKSTSARNLPPSSTYIINTLKKPLPWKGSGENFSLESKNMAPISEWDRIQQLLQAISDKRPEIKTIVVDDSSFIMSIEFFNRSEETGFKKFSDIGKHMFEITNTAKDLRKDLHIIFMFHEEVQYIDGSLPERKIKTIGKLLDDKFTPEALFTVLLYTKVQDTKEGVKYQFVTNRVAGLPAKSPMGMFEELYIDNDLADVLNRIDEYYG